MSQEIAVPITGQPKTSSLMPFGQAGIQLQTVEQALVFAKAAIESGLCPPQFKTPQAVLLAIQAGAEIGLGPFASLQSFAVINNRPSIFGDAGKGILRANGFDIEETNDGTTARCTVTHPNQKPVTRTFTIEDAKRAQLWGKNGPWSQYPLRQMSWRAFWFAARDAAAHVLKGVAGAEEMRDTPAPERNVTPQPLAHSLEAIDAPKTVQDEPKAEEKPSAPLPDNSMELPFQGDEQTKEDIAASRARG